MCGVEADTYHNKLTDLSSCVVPHQLLSDSELSQLDELYRILTPARQGNPRYNAVVC